MAAAQKPVVLVVGVTGMLGARIAHALLEQGEAKVRALVRPGSQDKPEVAQLAARGVELAPGDVLSPESLGAATRGVHTVVSALNNVEELIVRGQENLLRAAERNDVRRFIPSDFSVDYRKLALGDHFNLDMRKRFLAVLEQSAVEYTLVLQGAFTEMLPSPFLGLIDAAAGTYNYWGDGHMPMDFTTIEDTARYTARAALDPGLGRAALLIAGDVKTHEEIRAIYGRVKGRALAPRRLGSVDELGAWIAEKKASARNPLEYVAAQYHWTMTSGRAKLEPLMNDRYPEIRPTTIEEFLRAA